MLSRDELMVLYRELQEEPVLSVYLGGGGKDPTHRGVWRRRLDKGITHARESLDPASQEEKVAFDNAVGLLTGALTEFEDFLPGKGWVGFATQDRVWHAETVHVQVPDLVRWESGMRVAPYIRELKQERAVLVVLVDSRRARVLRYQDGEVSEPTALRADTFLGDMSDSGSAHRATTSTGTRGGTATDQASRYLEVGSERLLRRLMDVVSELMGRSDYLVLGGPQEVVSGAARMAEKTLGDRVLEDPSLHLDLGTEEVKEAARKGASAITHRAQERLLDEVVELAGAGGKGCIGAEDTVQALEERCVDTLLVSREFILGNPDLADRSIRLAFDQDATVKELSSGGGTRLDENGGVAARLRYRVKKEE
ncbi:hypothetical protein ACGF5M_05185 [Gemmatimonadota bacterium]